MRNDQIRTPDDISVAALQRAIVNPWVIVHGALAVDPRVQGKSWNTSVLHGEGSFADSFDQKKREEEEEQRHGDNLIRHVMEARAAEIIKESSEPTTAAAPLKIVYDTHTGEATHYDDGRSCRPILSEQTTSVAKTLDEPQPSDSSPKSFFNLLGFGTTPAKQKPEPAKKEPTAWEAAVLELGF